MLVCMVDSIHVARWISQFDPCEVEFILFPSTPNRRVHSIIKKMISENGNIQIAPLGGKLSIFLWGIDLIFSNYIRGLLLRKVLRRHQPDFVHALELQHAGYITSRALEDYSIKTTFIATNYGSDIYWFQQFPRHIEKIKNLLTRADRYSAECERDIDLAIKHGFTGEIMPVFPNAGGFTDEQLSRSLTPASERKIIAIKGYEGWVGRASEAIEALHSLSDELEEFKIVFYSCNVKTIRLVRKLKKKTKLNVVWHGKKKLTHEEMLDLFASARIYIGVSLSDGISTSLLEAMAMGAFPIQTGTACAREWLSEAEMSIITTGAAEEIGIKLRNALSSSNIDKIAELNRDSVRKKTNMFLIREKANHLYFIGTKETCG